MFYLSIIESIICFGISCWGSAVCNQDKNEINKIIKKDGSHNFINFAPMYVFLAILSSWVSKLSKMTKNEQIQ